MTIPNNYYYNEPKPTSVGGQTAFSTTTLDAMLATNSAPAAAAAAVPTNTTYSNANVKPSAHVEEVEFDDRIKNVPWWKQPTKIFLVCCISLALAVGLGVGLGVEFSRQPSSTGNQCFANRDELKDAVITYVFSGCNKGDNVCPDITSKYGWPMNSWCVGNVTDMSELFRATSTFNEDVSSWDVSQVQDMSYMFSGESSFNRDLSSWNVSQVQSMSAMFSGARSFNGDLSLWDVSHVKDMSAMFRYASSFNGDISLWNVSQVQDMNQMFWGATSFNVDVSLWDISQVQNMYGMFHDASSFTQNLCSWADKNFPYDNARRIFYPYSSKGCTYKSTPQIDQGGPFCASDCN
jgi:surface protein